MVVAGRGWWHLPVEELKGGEFDDEGVVVDRVEVMVLMIR